MRLWKWTIPNTEKWLNDFYIKTHCQTMKLHPLFFFKTIDIGKKIKYNADFLYYIVLQINESSYWMHVST